MSNFTNLFQYIMPSDVMMDMLKTYKWLGKNKVYQEQLNNNLNAIIDQTIERDTYFLASIMNLEVSDSRMRLLITKNSEPRTKDERIITKLKDVLLTISKTANQYPFNSSDLLSMINTIYGKNYAEFIPDVIPGSRKKQIATRSVRHLFNSTIDEYNLYFEKNQYEHIILSLVLYIEIINLNPFTKGNELVKYLALYYMFLRCDVECFKYVSFFEILYDNLEIFNKEQVVASLNYKDGFINISSLARIAFKIINSGYLRLEEVCRKYYYEEKFNKSDIIENTIRQLPTVFTKEDIRAHHPYVSEATINRVLIKLKDDGYIVPLSKGRSARWMKTNESNSIFDNVPI